MKSVKSFALLTISSFVNPLFQLPPPPLPQMPLPGAEDAAGTAKTLPGRSQCSQRVSVLKELRSVLLGV